MGGEGPRSGRRAQCTGSLGVRVGGPHGRAGSSGGAPTGGPGVYWAGDRQALEKPGLGGSERPPTPALTPRTVAPPAGRSLGSRPGLGSLQRSLRRVRGRRRSSKVSGLRLGVAVGTRESPGRPQGSEGPMPGPGQDEHRAPDSATPGLPLAKPRLSRTPGPA